MLLVSYIASFFCFEMFLKKFFNYSVYIITDVIVRLLTH